MLVCWFNSLYILDIWFNLFLHAFKQKDKIVPLKKKSKFANKSNDNEERASLGNYFENEVDVDSTGDNSLAYIFWYWESFELG